jgi:dTDP-3-amino-3,4,6-trideoxy-alpha-D-glucose transaminase
VSTAAYSFYPTKNLGALGDAGAVVTPDAEVAHQLRMLRSHGERAEARGIAVELGVCSRLDEVQAELLTRKLAHLDAWDGRRGELAAFYRRELADAPVEVPVEVEEGVHSWHLFVVLAEDRDAFRTALRRRGVDTLVHYPEAIHRQPAYTALQGGCRSPSRSASAAASSAFRSPRAHRRRGRAGGRGRSSRMSRLLWNLRWGMKQ